MKYHLGCGGNYFQGYINVDFPQSEHTIATVKADIYSSLLDLKYEPCEEIRSHHVFEHFNYVESFALLVKWTRALKMGGILRIDLPDMEALSLALAHAATDQNSLRIFRCMRMIYGSHEAEWAYHVTGWTQTSLSYILEELGYTLQECRKYGDPDSDFPNCGIDMSFIKIYDKDVKEIAKNLFSLYAVEPSLNRLFKDQLDKLC